LPILVYDLCMKTQNSYPVICDLHCDTLWRFEEGGFDMAALNSSGHVDLPRLKQGGVALQFFALCVAAQPTNSASAKDIIKKFQHFLRNNKHFFAVKNLEDLESCRHGGDIGCLLSLEGAEPLGENLDSLLFYYTQGVRSISLTWNRPNIYADYRLTARGKQAIKQFDELGIILDLAHISPRSFYDALKVTVKPPLVSHANARALCEHPRNLTDEQLKYLAEVNGLIGLSYYPPFIGGNRENSLEKLVDHFVHIADLIGVEHLAIGSDFDGIDSVVPELFDCSCHPVLIDALYRRGFHKREVEMISFENARRLIINNFSGAGYRYG
jgi:membrane dipeptidase